MPGGPNSFGNTDGQIYTLTVLNGSEQWLKKEITEPSALPLDLDTLLGGFPGYIKSEYSYEDSGFGTEKQDEIIMGGGHHQQQQQQQSQAPTQSPHLAQHNSHQQQSPLPVTSNHSTNLSSFHSSESISSNNPSSNTNNNNNNDWQMADHNHSTEQVS